MSIVKLTINGLEIEAQAGQTIVAAAKANGIEIPTLCHDARVKPYGACGVCCVEAEGVPKLLRACSTFVSEGMKLHTDSPRALHSRRAALELLLSDHDGDCRPPCVLECPGHTDCQGYVALIANGQPEAATRLIKEKLPLPASIGRVCPHPCETACRRKLVEEPISIAFLKAFAADADLQSGKPYMPDVAPETGKNVCIIGGGPGGLTAAYFLRRKGHSVKMIDAMPKMGGMLRYGIPEYRLPKAVLDAEIALIADMGVVMENNVRLGGDVTLEALRGQYDAVVLAVGAWTSTQMRVPGEELPGVVGGIDYLRANILGTPMLAKRVAVVGGGNTAMDAVRTAVRLGAEQVSIIYRRTKAEMPAEAVEIAEAEEEGVHFRYLQNPIEILAENGSAAKLRLQKMELGAPDASGRRAPVAIPGAEELLDADLVIMAIGQGLNPAGLDGITLTKRGTIAADENTFRTNLDGVFAIGDATNRGAGIAIAAIGEASRAADVINGYLCGCIVPYKAPVLVARQLTAADFEAQPRATRAKMAHQPAGGRRSNFKEVNYGFTKEQAVAEAARCLECGCHDYFECKLIRFANAYGAEPSKAAGEKHKRLILDDHPFIERNPDKCVLCGLCARVCEEVMGVTALGLVGRGFDTIVKPALNAPLLKAGCISCGQCVAACPTGALGEKAVFGKRAPLPEDMTETTCGFCGKTCDIVMASVGGRLTRVLPGGAEDDKTVLCAKGRFGLLQLANAERVSSTDAAAKRKAAADILRGANASVAAAFSAQLTNEAALETKTFVAKHFPQAVLFSFGEEDFGNKSVVEIANNVKIIDGQIQGLGTGGNTAGLAQIGINGANCIEADVLLVFGDGALSDAVNAKKRIVFAAYAQSAYGADVALPFPAVSELSGTVVSAEGVTKTRNALRNGQTLAESLNALSSLL